MWHDKPASPEETTAPDPSVDPVNPGHYKNFDVSPIDLIKAYNLDFCDGNVVKYVARADHKNGDEDRYKALWYLLCKLGLPDKQCEGYTKQIREFVEQIRHPEVEGA